MEYRDSHGRTLEEYPRPSVAVDTAVLTVPPGGELTVVLIDGRRLPGTFLHQGERLQDAVLRSLREKAAIVGLRPQQLRVFDATDRDDRGWVISVAHLDVVPVDRLANAALVPVAELPPLLYDHSHIVELAVATLRDEYAAAPDPRGLLPEPFTLRALHRLHQSVAGRELQRDTFRRGVLEQLVATGEKETGGVGKPAQLFGVRSSHRARRYVARPDMSEYTDDAR